MRWSGTRTTRAAPGSELYFLRARYYDPEIGRFLGQDALPAANPYAYVGNSPTNLIDPSGLCHKELGYDQICRIVHELYPDEDQADETDNESYTGGDQADERGEDTESTPTPAPPDSGDAYHCSMDPLCARPCVGGQVSFECAAFGRDCYSQEHLRRYPPLPREAAEPSPCQEAIGKFILFDAIPTAAGFGVGKLLSSAPKVIQVGYGLISGGGTVWSVFDVYRLYRACQ